MNDEQRRQRRRQRFLLPISVLIILFFLIVGLRLAYKVAARRLMPGGPTLVYRISPAPAADAKLLRAEAVRLIRLRLNNRKALVRAGAEAGVIEVLLPKVSEAELLRARGRIETHCTFGIYDVPADADRQARPFVRDPMTGYYRPLPLGAAVPTDLPEAPDGAPQVLLVAPEPAFTWDDADPDGFSATKDSNGAPALRFALRGPAIEELKTYTERRKGLQVAICVNDVIVSAPTVQTSIPGKGIIAGPKGFTAQQAEDFAAILRAGPYPVRPVFIKLIPAPDPNGE